MTDQSLYKRIKDILGDQTERRRLLLRALRLLNFSALILAFWPLILGAEWIDRTSMPYGYLSSGLICLGFGLAALLSMIPLTYRQMALRKQQNPAEDDTATANLSDIEAVLYPEPQSNKPMMNNQTTGRHSARALGEVDAYKAWRRQTRQYWVQRIMGTVGINVIRAVLMLVFGLVFAFIGKEIGMISMVVLAISAMLLTLYAFDIPNRGYADIFQSMHMTAHIAMVLIFQMIRSFFNYPLQPDFHLFILFYLTFVYFLTRNQANIDHLMRQGSRSLRELPHGLRGFNARLTSLLTLAFPLIYIARRPIATVLRFLWDLFVLSVSAVMRFLNSLFPEGREVLPSETAATDNVTDPVAEAGSNGYWLRTIMTALVITVMIYFLRRYGRQMLMALANGLRRLKLFIQSLFQGEHEASPEVEEGRYYTDYHMALDPSAKRSNSYRKLRNRWLADYRKYQKRYLKLPHGKKVAAGEEDMTRYREAFALALRWLDLKEESGLDLSDTVREIARHHGHRLKEDRIASEAHFEEVTGAYEDVRYGVIDKERYSDSFDLVLTDLEEQLGRMADRM